jgi:hypothetical protein
MTGKEASVRRPMGVAACLAAILFALLCAIGVGTAAAAAPSGAIFTTLPDGSEVNFNIYSSKELVYLDGGPGPGAPATAAGLDDGTYVFQVTDPSGKTLLSTDIAACRRFTVSGGIITGVVAALGCEHVTGLDVDHGATTVQLMPFLDTPNPGGVYKVWATLESDYLAGCAALGVPNGLAVVDCGHKAGVAVHGFMPDESKTDNFKVKGEGAQEIDTKFFDYATGSTALDGMHVTWTDPVGATNEKWSYYAPQLAVVHEAHVEAVTAGTHYIEINDQPGCRIGAVRLDGALLGYGPRSVAVKITSTRQPFSIGIRVVCKTG